MTAVLVGKVADFKLRDRKVVALGEREVGVFRLGADFYAWENSCAHAGGPVCQGKVLKRVEERIGEDRRSLGFRFSETQVNIVCPWHGYEYDIRTGCHQGNAAVRLRPVPLEIRGDDVYLLID